MPIGVYSKETADKIYKWYEDTHGSANRPDPFDVDEDWTKPWYIVKLTEALGAASNPLTGYTQATANVLKYTPTDDLDRVEVTATDFEIIVTNRLPTVSLSNGAFLWVKKVGAEFVPLFISTHLRVLLLEDLESPEDLFGTPATAQAVILDQDEDNKLVRRVSESDSSAYEEVTVYNYFTAISFECGTYLKVDNPHGVWEPYAANCLSDVTCGSSSGSV